MSDNLRVLSIRQPWCHAILEGGKQIENRNKKLPADWMHCPVLLHVSKTRYSQDNRKSYHGDVMMVFKDNQNYQKQFPEFSNFHVFDIAMSETGGKILGVIKFNAGNVENSGQFPFYDVPTKTAHHWCIDKVYKFNTAISGHKGNTGWLRVADDVQQEIIDKIFGGDISHLYEVMECDDDSGPGPAPVQEEVK